MRTRYVDPLCSVLGFLIRQRDELHWWEFTQALSTNKISEFTLKNHYFEYCSSHVTENPLYEIKMTVMKWTLMTDKVNHESPGFGFDIGTSKMSFSGFIVGDLVPKSSDSYRSVWTCFWEIFITTQRTTGVDNDTESILNCFYNPFECLQIIIRQ